MLNFLVETQIKLNRYTEARDAMHESISLCEQTKNRWGMATAYRYLGLVALAEGQYIEAQSHFHESLEIFWRRRICRNLRRDSHLHDLLSKSRAAQVSLATNAHSHRPEAVSLRESDMKP
jgi:uncharacterized protein HemY